MVKLKETLPQHSDGSINLEAWLTNQFSGISDKAKNKLRAACTLSQLAGEDQPTYTGKSCLEQGLAMAELLNTLNVDLDTLCAAIIYDTVKYGDLELDDVAEHLGKPVSDLVHGVEKLDAIRSVHGKTDGREKIQIDNLRKMLLTMVSDIRVVLIKLAERACVLRVAKTLSEDKRHHVAREVTDIYAPLANRLGMARIKWEMEDLAFFNLHPNQYKSIAKHLAQKRSERENFIEEVKSDIKNNLSEQNITAEITGRAKHIYSIFLKMQRKNVDASEIYDALAVRVLVDKIDDCYAVLSCVHALWKHIPEEFDDYIANPKPNGYQSLHTAVEGPGGHSVEIQIRTHQMHEESELGVAAHWKYKEGGGSQGGYEDKIALLRQVMDWQKEVAETPSELAQSEDNIFDDRIYVFTPTGDIIELPNGATPLDFAYHVHSEVGHRCRGAKISGHIVPLTHKLNTGDQVEVLTAKNGTPSRDWVNPHLGYLKSPRAKAKVIHWFKQQDYDRHVEEGQEALEKEAKKLNLPPFNTEEIAKKMHFKNTKDFFAAIGRGDSKITHVIHHIQGTQENLPTTDSDIPVIKPSHHKKSNLSDISIAGVGNLLSQMGKCCKPVPGDSIIGFITQGRGVTIHRKDCPNILNASEDNQKRLIDVQWEHHDDSNTYPVDIEIIAHDRKNIVRDVTAILSNEKINVSGLITTTDKKEHTARVVLTIEIPELTILSRLMDKFNQLPNIIEVHRAEGR